VSDTLPPALRVLLDNVEQTWAAVLAPPMPQSARRHAAIFMAATLRAVAVDLGDRGLYALEREYGVLADAIEKEATP